METAHYAAKILNKTTEEQAHNSDYICCYAIHPNTGLPTKYCKLCNSSEGAEWIIETANEVGRLAQGNGDTGVDGTSTMFFIQQFKIPKGRKPTYL